MKTLKALSLIGLFLICSCEKSYNCTVTTKVGETTIESNFTFKGTHKEMKELQETISTNQTLDCK